MHNKLSRIIVIQLLFLVFSCVVYAQTQEELKEIFLESWDFQPSVAFEGISTNRKTLGGALWQRSEKITSSNDLVSGVIGKWRINDHLTFHVKYGKFSSPGEAEIGARTAIFHTSPILVHFWPQGSFTGQAIGDRSFNWDLKMEKDKGWLSSEFIGDTAIISFTQGNYAIMLQAEDSTSSVGSLDKGFIEAVAKKAVNKINVATSLNNFSTHLSSSISHKGILNSLQVKLDHFTKNYRQGDYKVALNNINSFINELNAQRGKHVSESAYQTLKAYADTIVQSLNALM